MLQKKIKKALQSGELTVCCKWINAFILSNLKMTLPSLSMCLSVWVCVHKSPHTCTNRWCVCLGTCVTGGLEITLWSQFVAFTCLLVLMIQARYLGFFRKHLYPLKHLLRPLLLSLAYKGMGAILSTFVLLFCSPWIFSAFITHPAGLCPEHRRKKSKLCIQSC